ncbi:hypothetical protein XELAEV_18012117mg [Xenopus laevis]|uniref:Uncharacterized protein n=1 Tax=Xenopus laevis TaxID=8355 RepID=A0A974DPD3_XENLA|nr:hypothetical protein XELAEV_18012117mg [Xenopus laevis]
MGGITVPLICYGVITVPLICYGVITVPLICYGGYHRASVFLLAMGGYHCTRQTESLAHVAIQVPGYPVLFIVRTCNVSG